MAVVTRKQKDEAQRQISLKLVFEVTFGRMLTRLSNKIARDLKTTYLDTRQVIDINRYVVEFNEILQANYVRIDNKFSSIIVRQFDKGLGVLPDNDKNDLKKQLALLAAVKAAASAAPIIKTLQKIANQIVFDAQHEFDDINKIANVAAKNFRMRAATHLSSTVAITETQSSSETSKELTAAYIIARLGGSVDKRWITRRDDKVRPVHRVAEGQTVSRNEFFLVGGEQLMFPGDPRGSIWNIANCRCVVFYVIKRRSPAQLIN